ncbi:DUF1203 domain-containing protein [Bowmanella dokdonensis]|uniref:DUF1203 domain-containing protein n=1 Tax=Bowmanella dokdonensis TaxID=751969 RepID=A0A939DNA0_9ALTE|nr:DUF1203 domain-containing protein [Bowmanella dokdonensis]MBN7825357.1 DUF1203 domain-containing protein [Bowmanella dokdonensis]
MSFQFHTLDHQQFEPLYGLSEQELAKHGVLTARVDHPNSYPCRITLQLPEPGERMLLVNYWHLDVESPFRSCYAIYVREGQVSRHYQPGEIPVMFKTRRMALRAFCPQHRLKLAALVADEPELRQHIEQYLANPEVEYLHLHSATHGCYLARISRPA